ncbi:MAG: PDZ domain-containing protein [Actinobacteria bacterium]|nr:PDZ domain-containing protein [Actinomycetota bacterium]
MRRILYALSALVIAWAVFTVPLPLLVTAPADATPICDADSCAGTAADDRSVIAVRGNADPLTGEILLTTVTVFPTTSYGAIQAWLDPYEDVSRREQLIPTGIDTDEFFATQREVFEESVQVAAAVGLRAAGRDVTIEGDGARVVEVIPGSAADGKLQAGDVIIAANDEQIELSSQLAALTQELAEGEEITLQVERDGSTEEITLETAPIPGTGSAGVGVFIETVNQQIRLPDDIEVTDRSGIGGPSAGLMLALTVYDLFNDANLLDGRLVAGTGTIGLNGQVGPIGGIEKKVRGAVASEADVFLAPAAQIEAARSAAPDDLRVVAVATFQDAIDALQQDAGGSGS